MAKFRLDIKRASKEETAACLEVEKAFNVLIQAVASFNDKSAGLKMQVSFTMKHFDWPEGTCRRETVSCIGWDRVKCRNVQEEE